LTWRSRDGRQVSTLDAPGTYLAPKLSPDGGKLAVTRADPVTGNADVWIMDSSRNVGSRFTFDPAFDFHPLWSRDGKQIVFSSNRSGPFNLFRKNAFGTGEEEQISKSDTTQLAEDWSPDGRFIYSFWGKGPRLPKICGSFL
jgi:Tol biopolymer transport system component